MKNVEIKYTLSTDYDRLYTLLKKGNLIIGFIAIDIDNKVSKDYSKITTLSYNTEGKFFNIGFIFFEPEFSKIDFKTLCIRHNIRFFDLN